MSSIYNTMYRLSVGLWIGDHQYIPINSSDVVSIAIIHQYDTSTYPIMRFRIYADMELVEDINEDPDHISVVCSLDGGIYQSGDNDETSRIVRTVPSISFTAKAYLENKNIPVSKMDQYKMGEKDTSDLNVDSKVPFELFVYDDNITHKMRQKAPSIYRNVAVETVVRDLLRRTGLPDNRMKIDAITNQKRYDQILIPNLTTIEAFTYFDRYYGLYDHGGMLYYDFISQTLYLGSSASDNQNVIPIYVRSEKFNSDEAGIIMINNTPRMQANAMHVSVLSESDIERVLNPEIIANVNVNTLAVDKVPLRELFDTYDINTLTNRIEQKNVLHKTDRKNLSTQEAARLNERITHVDLSGAGFPLDCFTPMTRYNLVFESAVRGINLAKAYRPKYVCHVLHNASGDLFVTQTTMELCSN